jgi:hypothetical protein
MSEEAHSPSEEEPTTRPVTTDEKRRILIDYKDPYYSLTNQRFEATWNDYPVYSETGKFPWIITESGQQITTQYYEREYPGYGRLENFNYQILGGLYHTKKVRWNSNRRCWQYLNNQNVQFSDSEEEPEETTQAQEGEASTSTQHQDPESDDQAEVSQLLESAAQEVSTLITQVSRPQTPQTVPGALPVTPAQTTQVQLPTPTATTALPPALPPIHAPSPSLRKALAVPLPRTPPVVVPAPPPIVLNPPMAGTGGNTKILGAAPEPFEGKPEKAEAFWNNLENYFYLNGDVFNTDGKKISSALTYFKIGTSAREWAQDLQKKALDRTPVSFRTWATFKDGFKKHFTPAHSALEATNAMYTSKMGGRPFNEWYQDWSTYASRSGANEDTQMFAFQKALPMALHQKIMGVSPQPTTLEGLAEKAREFDRLWRMYSNPAFTRNSGPRNHALTTEEDHIQANVATTSRPQMGGKISKEEKDRCFKEKLCFYCGKPNHTAKEC